MSKLKYNLFYERNLPHFQPPGATIFITSRLVNSLPTHVIRQLREEADRVEAAQALIIDPEEREQKAYLIQRRNFGRWDKALDSSHTGPFWMGDPRIADLVLKSIHHLDNQKYCLDVACVMANHVHIVFAPLPKDDDSYHALSSIMHSIKRFTSREANIILNRSGQFWQHENYDHVVRDEAELERIVKYVIQNPVSAGFVQDWRDWKWTYCRYEM